MYTATVTMMHQVQRTTPSRLCANPNPSSFVWQVYRKQQRQGLPPP